MENQIAVLLFEYSGKTNKAGDRIIRREDLKKFCDAVVKIKQASIEKI